MARDIRDRLEWYAVVSGAWSSLVCMLYVLCSERAMTAMIFHTET